MSNIQLVDPRKDFDGNDLNIGDKVAFIKPHDRQMSKGEIIDFTKQMIRIKTGVKNHWKTGELLIMTELREPRAVVKI
jgi:RNase P/RNase MRP subunit p29